MKSNIIESRMYLECDCYSPNHLLCVDLLEEDEQPEGTKFIWLAEMGFISDYNAPFFNRMLYALKYIFFKKPYYVSDTVSFSNKNLSQLYELADTLKKQYEKLECKMKKKK